MIKYIPVITNGILSTLLLGMIRKAFKKALLNQIPTK